ncbi:uncharacterized protein LY89DRAFT_163083 [Mollisia scopiformis]|uniref:Uncharacterized protein n=1 Tax=Mollisia scopiformis TaxID=149040 RepID=A0A194XRQ8_MOLSC|nr:uncharacterized protein LY89DRAFT_163083 [Mollisia scopiformis]KUJ22975.1 hypothetical protein LY89DRAFT_163083 [Mollisia scopiformis]
MRGDHLNAAPRYWREQHHDSISDSRRGRRKIELGLFAGQWDRRYRSMSLEDPSGDWTISCQGTNIYKCIRLLPSTGSHLCSSLVTVLPKRIWRLASDHARAEMVPALARENGLHSRDELQNAANMANAGVFDVRLEISDNFHSVRDTPCTEEHCRRNMFHTLGGGGETRLISFYWK